MSSTYSSSLRIELIGSGDQAGTWGATTDSNLTYIMDTAVAGFQAVPVNATAQALTYVNGPSSTANLNQSVYAMLSFTGASAATSIYAPPVSKQYILWNNTSFAITIYNSTVIGNTTAAGTGVTLAVGDKVMVWSNGTNFYEIKTNNVTGTVAIVNGGTGQTTQQAAINALTGTQTASRVLRSDGTNATLSQVALSTDVTGTLPNTNGGTGQSAAFTQYGVTYASTTAALATTLAGTSTTVLHGNAGGAPSFGAVSLTADVSGTLPIANGGTNSIATATAGGIGYGTGTAHAYTAVGTTGQALISAAAAAPAFGTLGVAGGGTGQTSYTVGDILYASSTSALSKLGLGAANQILAVNSGATGLVWTTSSITFGTTGLTPSTASTGAVTVAGTLVPANGGTGVANNNLATVTSSGNFAYTRTLSAATNVTFPTTGTLATLAGTETLTNKTLTTPVISSITNTGTLTLPTSTDTLVGRATTDTLTSKTLTNPTITNYVETLQAVGTVGAASTLALTNGTVLTATLTASTPCTFTMPTATAGKSFILILIQAATGMTTATFSGVKWPDGTAPTITATASAVDILSFVANGSVWYGSASQAFA